MTQRERDIEQLAIRLREAAFPKAGAWASCYQDTQRRWIRAATVALDSTDRAVAHAMTLREIGP